MARTHFPKLPVEAEVNLEKHLLNVQETVAKELLRLAPLLKTSRLLGFLIDCYHRQTFAHLHGLLRHVTSTKKGFVLMEWALNTYLSQELLGHPDLQDKDLMKPVDLLLLTDWVQQAQDKLLLNMQVDISRSLEKILQNEKNEKSTTEDEEAFVRLHVDTIQCINANLQTAEHISPVLKERVREVCFQELQDFVKRYISMQKKTLEKQAKMDRPETTHFFKTLNTCKELKLYVQTNGKGIKNVDHVETVTALENMEAFTVKLLMDNLIQITESYLKRYFKKDDKQMLLLIDEIREQFHRRPCCLDVQKRVMDEAYQRISQIYFEHLVRSSQKKLEARWSDAAGRRVSQDAELLHLTFSDLSPEVRRWNLVLLTVRELLDCRSTDALKMTVAKMLQDCSKESCSVDLELLPALLRFRGDLSGWEVREVLDACLPDQPRPASCCCWS
ncbi:exocyst complex component 3 [Centroberyx gerrardi]